MNILRLVHFLVETNRELVQRTALRNCHCIGLNSFIINEKPRMRLFIAEPDCELFGKVDLHNPIIPIHAHKYDDLFTQIEGNLCHYFYSHNPTGNIPFKKYEYGRIGDKTVPIFIEDDYLQYAGNEYDLDFIPSNALHTVKLFGTHNSWVITELQEDKNFEQVAYHQNLVERKELYQPMENAVEYILDYFQNH